MASTAEHRRGFIDTNVWLYALVEGRNPQKTSGPKSLLVLATDPEIILISTQVSPPIIQFKRK